MKSIPDPISRCLGFNCPGGLLIIGMLAGGLSAQALVITPSWDSTITSDPNAAVIQSTINTAIQYYQTRFNDPITVTIQFREITTAGLQGQSSWWYYNISWSQCLAALQSDATTTNDTIALANLPVSANNPVTGTSIIRVKTANLRALGITGLNSGLPGGVDGIIGLHTSQMNLSRASIDPGKYDLLSVAEHEIDEILGLASSLDSSAGDPLPEDLFRYTSAGSRTFTASGDNAYFSIDGTNLLARFNQSPSGDRGDWWTAGAHAPQVQDAFITPGATPNPKVELIALDAIGYDLLPAPQPVITALGLSGTNLVLNGTNGLASGTYYVLTSTNLTRPLNLWLPVATNMLSTSGNFTIPATNAVNRSDASRFFFLQLQ